MKKTIQFSLFASCLGLALVLSLANSSGPSFGAGARTGAPGEGLCSNCHGGGTFSPSIQIELLEGGSPVSEYEAGLNYTLRIQITGSSANCYGAQATILDGNDEFVGALSNPAVGMRVATIGNRSYIEHSSRSSSGIFTATWTAPAAGSGSVRVYAAGIACNNAGSSGDVGINGNLQINERVATSISYGGSSFCLGSGTLSPQITGTTGGSFSASPAGLVLNASTGAINLGSSAAGSYTISYNDGSSTVSQSITLNSPDQVSLSYSATSVCQSSSSPLQAQVTGNPSGTFSVQPAGLALNTSTGELDIASSQAGLYTIRYLSNSSCPDSSDFQLTVTAPLSGSFSYAASNFCLQESNPFPTQIDNPGGTFSTSSSALSLDTSTGEIDLTNSQPGNYSIVYTPSGSCVQSDSLIVELEAAGNASFFYAQSSYCLEDTIIPFATITGQVGGVFSASPAGLVFEDNSIGWIDTSRSQPGFYTIYYSIGGPCPAQDSTTIELQINCLPTALAPQEAFAAKLYPNPSSGLLFLELEGDAFRSLEIWDMQGRLLQRQEFAGQQTLIEFDGSAYSSGLYLLHFETQAGRVESKTWKKI